MFGISPSIYAPLGYGRYFVPAPIPNRAIPYTTEMYNFKPSEAGSFGCWGNADYNFKDTDSVGFNYCCNTYNFKDLTFCGTNNYNNILNFKTSIQKTGLAERTYNFEDVKTHKQGAPDYKILKNPPQNEDEFRELLIKNFEKYMGYNEKDGSYRKFSASPEWCADFVTYVVKETYRQSGKPIPEGFGHHRCEKLKQWAIDNNCFIQYAGEDNKIEIITNEVKIGDILIIRENGKSHTGIVTKINTDGSFETIEGNVREDDTDKVTTNYYPADDPDISGFIRLPY